MAQMRARICSQESRGQPTSSMRMPAVWVRRWRRVIPSLPCCANSGMGRATGADAAGGEQVEGALEGGGAVVVGAADGQLAVVQAVGVERDDGARPAAAEEEDGAAGAGGGKGVLPGDGRAGRLDGEVEALPAP